jgi:hypothetical protein
VVFDGSEDYGVSPKPALVRESANSLMPQGSEIDRRFSRLKVKVNEEFELNIDLKITRYLLHFYNRIMNEAG